MTRKHKRVDNIYTEKSKFQRSLWLPILVIVAAIINFAYMYAKIELGWFAVVGG